MASLDTNVLLRWLLGDVPAQSSRASTLIESTDRLRVEDAALIEIVYVLESVIRAGRDEIRDALALLMATASLEFDRTLWKELVELYCAHSKLSIVDVYLTLRARDEAPLLTFDRKLASQMNGVELL